MHLILIPLWIYLCNTNIFPNILGLYYFPLLWGILALKQKHLDTRMHEIYHPAEWTWVNPSVSAKLDQLGTGVLSFCPCSLDLEVSELQYILIQF